MKLAMLALSVWFVAGVATASTPPISKIEARSLPPAQVKQRVTAQLADVLIPLPYTAPSHPPVAPLSQLSYATRVNGAGEPDLCETTAVMFTFSNDEGRDADADTPTRVSDIDAHKAYRFLSPAVPAEDDVTAAQRKAFDDQCARIDATADIEFFTAPSALHAYLAALAFQTLVNDLKARNKVVTRDCADPSAGDCSGQIEALDLTHLSDVDTCGYDENDHSCLELTFFDTGVRIYVDYRYAPMHATQVQYVITADVRID